MQRIGEIAIGVIFGVGSYYCMMAFARTAVDRFTAVIVGVTVGVFVTAVLGLKDMD